MDKPERNAPLDDWLCWREYLMNLDIKPELMWMLDEEIARADALIATKHRQADDLCTVDDAPPAPDKPADDDLPF